MKAPARGPKSDGKRFPNRHDSKAERKRRIVIAHDIPLVRCAIASIIVQESPSTGFAEADSVEGVQRALENDVADLLITDIQIGGGDGLEMIKALQERRARVPILVLSASDERLFGPRSLRAGAAGFVAAFSPVAEIREAILSVWEGRTYLSHPVMATLLSNGTGEHVSTDPVLASLSDRELQVYCLLGLGSKTRDISSRFHLSVKTVETYRDHLKHKLGVRDGKELVARAREWAQHGACCLRAPTAAA